MFYKLHLKNITGMKICLTALLVMAVGICFSGSSLAEDTKTYEESVVMIIAVQQEYDFATPWKKAPMMRGSGSGFIIEGNRILTNAHNVANQRYIEVKKQNQAQRYPAQVQFVGHDCDLAIITVPDQSFFAGTKVLEFGDLPKINSTVQTCGFPVGGRQVSMTEGVVSRLETTVYTHNQAGKHLVVQTDAAINPGNSGGPVLQNGKVVGVAFQGLQSADNIGYMIPTTIIHHFLKDIEDGYYHGFGMLGISLFPGLHNPGYKKYLKVPDDQDGVVIIDTVLGSTSAGKLQNGDIITKVDDFNIDNDGQVTIDGLSLDMTEILDRKQIGESVKIEYYRKGIKEITDVVIAQNEPILPWKRLYDQQPDYRVFSGMTFVPLNRNFLETWGRNWVTDLPFMLRYLFVDSNTLNKDPERKQYIVMSEILPDDVTAYSEGFKNQIVESVNSIDIKELSDLDEAFEKDLEGYWVIKFLGNPSPMVIDAAIARARNDMILQKYEVPIQTKRNSNEKEFLF